MKDVIARIKLESGFSSKFQTDVLREITKRIKHTAPRIKEVMTDRIRDAVRESLFSTAEYQSITKGKLRAELGIPEASTRITSVINTWVDNIKVTVKTGTTPLLLIDIGMIRDDYGDVLSLPAAQYTYRSKRSQGEIPWLKWLLLEGDKRIITKYEFSNNPRGSRTGMGIMVSKERGFWQVPAEFSGTSVNNFATRALGNIGNTIDSIVEQVVKESLK